MLIFPLSEYPESFGAIAMSDKPGGGQQGPRITHTRAPLKSFEIYFFREGRWWLDSVFDDFELAIYEARRLDERRRYSGVRVTEEAWDPTSNRITTRTIFRDAAYHKGNEEILARSRALQERRTTSVRRREEVVLQHKRETALRSRERTRRKTSPVRLLLILTAIVLGAMGAGLLLDRLERIL